MAAGTNQTASIIGDVTVNGVPTNGVTVTVGNQTTTTSTRADSSGVTHDGVYAISGLPSGVDLPFTASYGGAKYTDTLKALSAGQYTIPTVNINTTAGNPAASPRASATPTAAANSSITPTPLANASASPVPGAGKTNNSTGPSSLPAVTPGDTGIQVPPGGQLPAQSPPSAPPTSMPTGNVSAAAPTLNATAPIENTSSTRVDNATRLATEMPTAEASPTQTKSPGFEGLLAIVCLTGIVVLLIRKKER